MRIKKILIMLIACVAIILCFWQPTNTYADEVTYYCDACGTDHGPYAEIAVYEMTLNQDVYIHGVLPADSPMTSILKFDIEAEFKSVWEFAEKIYNILLGPGILLATAYFLLDLMEKVINDSLSAEGLSKMLIKLFLMVLLLMNGFSFLTEGMKIVTWCFEQLMVAFTGICGVGDCPDDLVQWSQSVWEHLGNVFSIYIAYLIIFLLRILAYVVAWKRVLKLIVLVMFAPIGMADSVKGGTSSQGFKYFKKIMAVTFEGTVILGAFTGYQLIKSSIATSPYYGEFAVTIILGICLYMMMSMAGMISEQILGC